MATKKKTKAAEGEQPAESTAVTVKSKKVKAEKNEERERLMDAHNANVSYYKKNKMNGFR